MIRTIRDDPFAPKLAGPNSLSYAPRMYVSSRTHTASYKCSRKAPVLCAQSHMTASQLPHLGLSDVLCLCFSPRDPFSVTSTETKYSRQKIASPFKRLHLTPTRNTSPERVRNGGLIPAQVANSRPMSPDSFFRPNKFDEPAARPRRMEYSHECVGCPAALSLSLVFVCLPTV